MSSFSAKQKEMTEEVAKDTIYETTLKVVSQDKNESLRMQDIADAAGMATGTLYNYFENKERLLCYVDRRLRETIMSQMQLFAEDQGPATERLKDLTVEILRFCEENHVVFDLAEQLGIFDQIPTDQKNEMIDQAVNCIRKILEDGVRQRVFRQIDATATARFFFFALLGGMKVQRYVGEYDPARYSKELLNSFQEYLRVRRS